MFPGICSVLWIFLRYMLLLHTKYCNFYLMTSPLWNRKSVNQQKFMSSKWMLALSSCITSFASLVYISFSNYFCTSAQMCVRVDRRVANVCLLYLFINTGFLSTRGKDLTDCINGLFVKFTLMMITNMRYFKQTHAYLLLLINVRKSVTVKRYPDVIR